MRIGRRTKRTGKRNCDLRFGASGRGHILDGIPDDCAEGSSSRDVGEVRFPITVRMPEAAMPRLPFFDMSRQADARSGLILLI